MVKTGILNDRVQNTQIYPDIYENGLKHEEVEPSRPSIFLETQKDTMQVPFQIFSMLDALMEGTEKAFDAAIYQCYNAFSHWDFGKSHSKSIREVGKLFSVSHQYVQQALSRLTDKKWLKRLSGRFKTSKFELKHHLCEEELVPLDRDGRPAKCAMPRGYGGLFERLLAGDISWKSLLIWMLLKIHSDFTTGITEPVSIEQLRGWTRFGSTTICDCIKELEWAGMLGKLERRPQEAQSYQLYPKPYPERRLRAPEAERTFRGMRIEGNWRYSFNEEWRIDVETGDIQYRPEKRGTFRPATDNEKYVEMPKRMREDFDMVLRVHSELADALLGQNPCPT
ncbi:MAG: hypothetical protein OXU23_03695 [Candidatus Poribacteria bacterium]|nr:hypothetical protein [Candidatus Poribacteria bacterium]